MDALPGTAPCGFVSFLDDGSILEINRTLRQMLRYEEGTPIRKFSELLTPGGGIFFQTHFFPLLKMNGKVEEIYLSLRQTGGGDVPVLVNAVRVNRDGASRNEAVIMRIQARGKFEEELLHARREAERANQAKDDFLAALSHELRTPLTPLLMTATALEGEPDLPPEIREQIGIIRRSAELEARLIDDLLDVTRITRGKLRLDLTEADVHALLGHTIELVRRDTAASEIDLQVSLDATEHHVSADETRLQQVFWNLLKNAIKFTPGGRVTVSTSNPQPGHITVRVTDTGIGIPRDALTRIFKAFEQGSGSDQRRFGGLGLGLAISSGIVSMHGGSITAESDGPGTGATFTVGLPGIPAPANVPTGGSPRPATPPGSLRILVVEDHDATRSVLTRLLTRDGHRVQSASTAAAALSRANAMPFDLVISDLGLPDRSGLDLMRELQARHQLKGIALSGFGMEEDLARSRKAGFCAHLVKPIRIDDLKVLLDRLQTGALD